MQLINRSEMSESHSKDYEFSRYTINEHWVAGRDDAHRSLLDDRWQRRDRRARGIATFDLTPKVLPPAIA